MRRLVVATLLLLCALPAVAQSAADSGAFVVTLGTDTVGMERYVRSATRLEVEGLWRVPQTRIVQMVVDWDASGKLLRYEVVNSGVPGRGGQAAVRTVATVNGDSIEVEVFEGGNAPRRRKMVTGSDVPFVNPFYSAFEVALARARVSHAKSVTLLNQNGPITYDVSWNGNIAVLSNAEAGTLRATMDERSRMRALSGAGTTFKVEVKAATPVDVVPIAAEFAQLDAAGKGLGMLSPRDTARMVVSGAVVMIDYGRPATRGRVIFGNVVPWNEVWRTGANAATQFELSRDVVINGVRVAAGKYTLWTIPTRGRWQLVVNKQAGQWGTMYDATQDLVRIPVTTQIVNDPVERFTITIENTNTGGLILMSWDRTMVRIPFTVL